MKKKVLSVLFTLTLFMLGSCSQKPSDSANALIDAIVSEAASTDTVKTTSEAVSAEALTAQAHGDPSVDIDLTVMNSTMIYSIIYDMMINAEDYCGKSLMVDGYFDTMVNEALGASYYFVVIPDATACCVQGLEFILGDPEKAAEGYPETGKDIRVKGVFDSYVEEGQNYYYIKADELTLL